MPKKLKRALAFGVVSLCILGAFLLCVFGAEALRGREPLLVFMGGVCASVVGLALMYAGVRVARWVEPGWVRRPAEEAGPQDALGGRYRRSQHTSPVLPPIVGSAIAAAIYVLLTEVEGEFSHWLAFALSVLFTNVPLLFAVYSYLEVRDEGDALRVGFGPFRKPSVRIPYAEMGAIGRTRASPLLRACAEVWLPVRFGRQEAVVISSYFGLRSWVIGTEEPQALLALLKRKIDKCEPRENGGTGRPDRFT